MLAGFKKNSEQILEKNSAMEQSINDKALESRLNDDENGDSEEKEAANADIANGKNDDSWEYK